MARITYGRCRANPSATNAGVAALTIGRCYQPAATMLRSLAQNQALAKAAIGVPCVVSLSDARHRRAGVPSRLPSAVSTEASPLVGTRFAPDEARSKSAFGAC